MATSTIAGELGGGILITCILNEGAPTVNSRAYNKGGARLTATTWASELRIGDIVALSNDTLNTYVSCGGLPVVEVPQNGETFVCGQIMSEPVPYKQPATTAAGDSWTKQLAGGYYRIATVEFWNAHSIQKAVVLTTDTGAVAIGDPTIIKYDISESTADHCLTFNDVANGGLGAVPLHYVAKAGAADFNILVAITGFIVSAT